MSEVKREIIEDGEIQRLMPHSEELEQIVLGSMILDEEIACPIVEDILQSKDIYNSNHRKIFEAIISLRGKKVAVDPLTVAEELKIMKCLDEIGGAYYLSQLAGMVSSTVSVEHYAKILLQKSTLRSTIRLSGNIIDAAFRLEAKAELIIDTYQQKLYEISTRGVGTEFFNMGDVAESSVDMIELYQKSKDGIIGIPTGFPELDKMTAGFRNKKLIIVAGRPKSGKSSWVIQVAAFNAKQGTPGGIITLEMGREEVGVMMASCEAEINWHYKRSKKEGGEYEKLKKVLKEKISKWPLYIDDRSGRSALDIRRTARQMKIKYDIKFLIVDYLQLMMSYPGAQSKNISVGMNAYELKNLAKDLDIPVIVVCATSRDSLRRDDPTPMMSDLRDSGEIEFHMDALFFIHSEFQCLSHKKRAEILKSIKSCERKIQYLEEKKDLGGLDEVKIKLEEYEREKNLVHGILNAQRGGPTGDLEMYFEGRFNKFRNAADISETPLWSNKGGGDDGLEWRDADLNEVGDDKEPF